MSTQQNGKIGDIVEITCIGKGQSRFLHIGDLATITRIDFDGDRWANFNEHQNAQVYGDGIWCIGRNETETYANHKVIRSAPISEKDEVLLDETKRNT